MNTNYSTTQQKLTCSPFSTPHKSQPKSSTNNALSKSPNLVCLLNGSQPPSKQTRVINQLAVNVTCSHHSYLDLLQVVYITHRLTLTQISMDLYPLHFLFSSICSFISIVFCLIFYLISPLNFYIKLVTL